MSLGLSAAAWGGISAIGGGLLGAYSVNKSNKSAAEQQQAAIDAAQGDPRAQAMLYGDGTKRLKPGVTPTWSTGQPDANGQTWDTASNPDSDYAQSGLLGHYQGLLGQPQAAGAKAFGQANDNYVGAVGSHDLSAQRDAAMKLMGGTGAPQASAATMGNPQAYAVGNMVNAPAQNGMNLTGSYDSLINGPAGANPFLTGAIGKGINQSNNAFGAMQRDSTKNLLENILPSIRSNAVLSGTYGSSRQGIAEGRAIDSFATEQQRSMSQFGQNNTDAAVAAQAGAYDADKNRQLSATQGLGAQQYGVASQDANTKNQAEFMNVAQVNNNQQMQAGFTQQTNLANLGAQQTTNSQNQAGAVAGTGLLGGILGTAAGQAQGQDGYDINKASQVNGLLQPYLAKPGTQVQPMYQGSTAGGLLGGAAGGLALYNQFKQASKPSSAGAVPGNITGQYQWGEY